MDNQFIYIYVCKSHKLTKIGLKMYVIVIQHFFNILIEHLNKFENNSKNINILKHNLKPITNFFYNNETT
jgi:hypothetical protein